MGEYVFNRINNTLHNMSLNTLTGMWYISMIDFKSLNMLNGKHPKKSWREYM